VAGGEEGARKFEKKIGTDFTVEDLAVRSTKEAGTMRQKEGGQN